MANELALGYTSPAYGSYTYDVRYPQGSLTEQGAQNVSDNYFPGWSVTGPTGSGYVQGLYTRNPNGWNVATPADGAAFVTVPDTQGIGTGSFFSGFDQRIELDTGDNLYYIYYTRFSATFQVVSSIPESPVGPGEGSCL